MVEPIIYAFGLLCSTSLGVIVVYTGFALMRALFVVEK